MEFVDWNLGSQVLTLKDRRPKQGSSAGIAKLQKRNGAWDQVKAVEEDGHFVPPDIFVEQDLNTPPHVVVANLKTGQKATLLELNPHSRTWCLEKSRSLSGSEEPITKLRVDCTFRPAMCQVRNTLWSYRRTASIQPNSGLMGLSQLRLQHNLWRRKGSWYCKSRTAMTGAFGIRRKKIR